MLKVLVVDDKKTFRDAIIFKLKKDGFTTFQAENGEEALTVSKVGKPDLIMLDLQMPVMDGFETLSKLRKSGDWGKKVKVIILTNFQLDNKITEKMVALKPMYYMVKTDWSLEEISTKIKELIGDPQLGM